MRTAKEKHSITFQLKKNCLENQYLMPLELYLIQNLSQRKVATEMGMSFAKTRSLISKGLFELLKLSDNQEYIKAKQILHGK